MDALVYKVQTIYIQGGSEKSVSKWVFLNEKSTFCLEKTNKQSLLCEVPKPNQLSQIFFFYFAGFYWQFDAFAGRSRIFFFLKSENSNIIFKYGNLLLY